MNHDLGVLLAAYHYARALPGEGAGWGKATLKMGKHVARTRGRDG
jgi:hypothetical protein